jgi:hypothetical protein
MEERVHRREVFIARFTVALRTDRHEEVGQRGASGRSWMHAAQFDLEGVGGRQAVEPGSSKWIATSGSFSLFL